MTDNKKINIDQLIQQDDLLKELTNILNDTDKTVLVDMLKRLAALAADAEKPETIEDFSAHVSSKIIAVFYAAHEAAGGRGPSEAVLETLGIEVSGK